MANNAGLQNILNMAIKNMGEDNTKETDLSTRSAEDLKWLQEAIEAGAAGADVDVKGTFLVFLGIWIYKILNNFRAVSFIIPVRQRYLEFFRLAIFLEQTIIIVIFELL